MKRPSLLPLRRSTSLSPAAPAPVQQAQGNIGITEYDQGRQLRRTRPDGASYFDSASASPQNTPVGIGFTDMGTGTDYVPGSSYFDPPPSRHKVVTAEDWFTADNQQRLLMRVLSRTSAQCQRWAMAPAGSLRMTRRANSRRNGGLAEINRAAQAGDQEKVDALLAERDRVLSAYDQYATDVEDWKTRYQDYEGQFNANLEAALTFDPRGEGGFSRTSSGELISNLDQQGWMDQLGTPQIVNPFTNEPQSMTDWQREAAIRDELWSQDYNARGPGDLPTRFAPAARR